MSDLHEKICGVSTREQQRLLRWLAGQSVAVRIAVAQKHHELLLRHSSHRSELMSVAAFHDAMLIRALLLMHSVATAHRRKRQMTNLELRERRALEAHKVACVKRTRPTPKRDMVTREFIALRQMREEGMSWRECLVVLRARRVIVSERYLKSVYYALEQEYAEVSQSTEADGN